MAHSGGHQRHQQHQAADLEDGALVASDDALVDDVRRQPRQQQVGERLREGQHEHQHEQPAMRGEKAREFQHRRGLQAPNVSRANSATCLDFFAAHPLVWQIVSQANISDDRLAGRMATVDAGTAARELLHVVMLVMRTVAADMRRSPAPWRRRRWAR